jgi:hypothetical protein
MAKRPDLDHLVVPKGAASDAPAAEAPSIAGEGAASKGYAHTLSYRMSAEQYRRLRRFVADQEEKTGKRITHQAFIEAAVEERLAKLGG